MASDLDLLQDLNTNYIRSVQESDALWFDANLSNDFVNSNADGSISDRAAFLALIAKPASISGLKCEDVKIRILGDVAIVHGRTVYRNPQGNPAKGRYTDVSARRGGRWVCVSADVTRG
jgi:ketosteroid isomerase-like protein